MNSLTNMWRDTIIINSYEKAERKRSMYQGPEREDPSQAER